MSSKKPDKEHPQSRMKPVAAMSWYDREQWTKLKAIAEDGERLDVTYDAWLAGAERAEAELARRDTAVRRVFIDVDEFVDWCRANNLKIISASRAKYTAEKARKQ